MKNLKHIAISAALACALVATAGCDFDGGFTSSAKGTQINFDSCAGDECDNQEAEK